MPIGEVEVVAVVIVIESHNAHKEESASPRKPKVNTEGKASKPSNFEV